MVKLIDRIHTLEKLLEPCRMIAQCKSLNKYKWSSTYLTDARRTIRETLEEIDAKST